MAGPPKRGPALLDRALWHYAVRDVAPLPGRAVPPAASPPPASEPPLPKGRAPHPANAAPGPDRATAERLKRGRYVVEARLDLHGLTQTEAHRALAGFIRSSHDCGRRCVLVITGRGLGPSGPGVLKDAVPRWLETAELRRHILAAIPAQPRHGGAGALYLLLRRRRDASRH